MEITGTIIEVLPLMSGTSQTTGKPWQSQEYVLQTEGQYPKRCCFRVFGEEKISQLNIVKGLVGTAHIEINAREYNGRWFNSIDCWKFESAMNGYVQQQSVFQPQVQSVSQPQPQAQPIPQAAPVSSPVPPQPQEQEKDDDLPF